MQYPNLVPESICNSTAEIKLYNGIDEDGEDLLEAQFICKCNIQNKKVINLSDAQTDGVKSSASILIPGSYFVGHEQITALYINIMNLELKASSIEFNRNPDASINFVKVVI